MPARGGWPALGLEGQHSYTGMLLHRLMLKENCSSQKKDPGIAVFQSVRVRGVSPVLVFFRYQFKLHCIHHEVVGKMGFLGLWTKSPYNNGSPGVWTEAGHPGMEMTQSQRAF